MRVRTVRLYQDRRVESQVKGNSFRTLLAAVGALRSAGTRQRVECALPEDIRRMLAGVVAGGWYPMSAYGRMHGTIARVCATGEAFARDLGRHTSQQDLKGFARLVFTFASPRQALGAAARIAPKYFRGTDLTVVDATPQSATLRCAGFAGSNALMWAEFGGGLEPLLEAAGGKAVRVHRLDGGGDSPDAEFALHWL